MDQQNSFESQPQEPIERSSSFSWIKVILLIIASAIVFGGLGFYLGNKINLNLSPSPTPKPGCFHQQVECIKAPCPPIEVCPTTTPIPTPDPTKDWKTYTYSYFSLKLPSDWKSHKENNPVQFANYDINSASGRSFDPILDKGKLKIEVYRTESGDNIRKYLDLQKQQTTNWVETETKVNGLTAIKVKTSNPGFVVYAQASTNEHIISIAFVLDFDNNQALANQILSTFKFTDQITDTTNPEGKPCGGFAGNIPERQCPSGYYCKLAGNFPDASGKCIKQ